MPVIFKTDSPIIARKTSHYNFGKLTGNFIISSSWGNPEFEVLIDGEKKNGELISVKDQEVRLVPFDSEEPAVFALNASLELPDNPVIDTKFQSGSYYELQASDCNFKAEINTEVRVHVYLKCNDIVLVDMETTRSTIDWPAEGISVLRVTSFDGSQIPVVIRRT